MGGVAWVVVVVVVVVGLWGGVGGMEGGGGVWQRQKNPVGVSALPTGKFLRVRKVFARIYTIDPKIKSKHRCGKFPNSLEKFPDSLESFRRV